LRILFATSLYYPPQGLGGARVSTHQLCEALAARGHQVAVIARIRDRNWLWLRNRLHAKCRRRLFAPDRVPGYRVYRGWEPIAGIPEVVRDFRPDVAVAGTAATLLLAGKFVEEKVPTVAYFRSLEFEKFGAGPADRTRIGGFAVSGYVADRIEEVLGIKCNVVRSIVKPVNYLVEGKRETVLHVNPEPCKGIEITLALAARRPDIVFDVVRCWEETPEVRRIRERTERMDNVVWHEPIGDMRALYARARLLLAPSICEEAAARVVQEAQLNAIPVLASDRGGLPESVGAGGMTVDPEGDISEWTNALDRIWKDSGRDGEFATAAWHHARRDEVQTSVIVERVEKLLAEHVRATAG